MLGCVSCDKLPSDIEMCYIMSNRGAERCDLMNKVYFQDSRVIVTCLTEINAWYMHYYWNKDLCTREEFSFKLLCQVNFGKVLFFSMLSTSST